MGVLKMNKHQSVTKVAVSLKRRANKSIWEKDGKFFIVGDYGYGNKTEHKGKVYSEVVSTGENSWCVGTSKEEKKAEQPIAGYTAPETAPEVAPVPEEGEPFIDHYCMSCGESVAAGSTECDNCGHDEIDVMDINELDASEREAKAEQEEATESMQEVQQLTLEKLSIAQMSDINKRANEAGEPEPIQIMTAEELELYKGNVHENITKAEELKKGSSKIIQETQTALIAHNQKTLARIEERLSSLRVELAKEANNSSLTQGELIPEGDELVFYGVSELATFVGEDKRLISKHNKLDKIEKPVGRVGVRPIWTHEQALRIKEYYESKR
jgi:predicted  nucleic acid-binding Zn-ribbon protein